MNHLTVVIVVMSKVIHVSVEKEMICGILLTFLFDFSIDYYKLNRLNRALAMQRITGNKNVSKNPHPRRPPRQHHVVYRPTSPPTPTPHNIDQLAAFYQRSLYMPQAQLVGDFGQLNY